MREIRRIGVGSVAKISGITYAVLGLILGALFSLISIIGASLSGSDDAGMVGLLFGAGAIILMPIFYGLLGVAAGALSAFLYNLVAGVVGGIEIELE